MDVTQMIAFHREAGADVTVAARPVPLPDASQFGVLAVDGSARVIEFSEKPARPQAMPGDPRRALVSMGNYLFSRQPLVDALLDDARRSTEHDFGRSIIPEMVPTGRVYGYDFQLNEVPGVKPYEEPAYWRGAGAIGSALGAHTGPLGGPPRRAPATRARPLPPAATPLARP